ncbi:GntR family transcriptional regulator [Halomonas denitrificans]|uniref:GntR family transcriptional regulator n=2 Tax=Halomonadaceae TaxID=28256 RepID=UPI001C93FE59|nr:MULTISPECIES: GntR family transcriptional regulator [Halomonas]MBY5928332.1 GntR family transcriptional regulator [Halomonas sp. DP8Y7-3]MBY5967134.1 GntR family transcriptional regulator [Halomonas denitrificans]MBY6208843.1 GntR family transcriptional regulator [Halomonas sp. DP3Y7-2]MBY6227313.1 GntR family transcriptional regulator [Halomonas sp. DP3Y7-1]MCA0914937.1 GntR family transcriptional regulator [Halomonas denitrificans]
MNQARPATPTTADIVTGPSPVAAAAPAFQPDTASMRIHQDLRRRLCEGEFGPGDVLSIRGVAACYDTSAMPAREAVRWLVSEGALQFVDSRKIIVPYLSRERFVEVLFARRSLESELARQAFPSIESCHMEALEALDDSINRAIEAGDLRRYMRGNHAFHFLIYRLSGSAVLLPLVEQLWQQYGPSMGFICTRWGGSGIADDHHREMTQALREGDSEAFCQALTADIEQGMQLLDDDAFSQPPPSVGLSG